MGLIEYVQHYCAITDGVCLPGVSKECPIGFGNLLPWCKNFKYRDGEEKAEIPNGRE